MILTRMELDITKRKTMLALYSPSMFHGAIEHSFTGSRIRKLWRIDCLNDNLYLLLLSDTAPNLENAVKEFGIDEKSWESKDYTPLLLRITQGSKWQFRLCANPTYSSKSEKDPNTGKIKRGKVHAHRTIKHQTEWLKKQSVKHGFKLNENDFSIVKSEWFHFNKGDKNKTRVKLLSVTYEGVLSVTNPEEFKLALINGIGREKAYGMGLLTLMKY